MARAWFLAFFVVSVQLLLHSAKSNSDSKCPESFQCGSLGPIGFPFTNVSQPSCGLCRVNCSSTPPTIQLENGVKWFEVQNLSEPHPLEIYDPGLQYLLTNNSCYVFVNISLPTSPSISYTIQRNITLFKCTVNNNNSITNEIHELFKSYNNYTNCSDFSIYFKYPTPEKKVSIPDNLTSHCWEILLPLSPAAREANHTDLFALLSAEFSLKWHVSEQCSQCHHDKKGHCRQNVFNEFDCEDDGKTAATWKSKTIILATTVIIGVFILSLIICLVIFIRLRKKKNHFSYFPSKNASSYASSNLDPEGSSVFYGVPVFSYSELVEATNNFQSSKELGDGGFGTVYYGKLKDGREVAVKRLYEHNPKRVERFMNEIEILTRLRHKNLVTLYGCTSRHSRELLLVYEYIPNGTVGDHLHGEKANAGQLTWPIRMNIAIETVSALAYLHASDIVHRDVKTTNILLDCNFHVKVADFGLSRLFPNDVTHVSTAPQGTPGYVDPEYHKCYQLTDKSDVYSFGVVLIELISSMAAVDISRHTDEINLANLAINKIQRCEYNELIDPKLGFETDVAVTRMTTSVAELAFRCLQQEKELRPTMDEVLEALKEIQKYEFEIEEAEDTIGISRSAGQTFSPDSEDVVLLKNSKLPDSPKSVADHLWVSCSTTTSGSGGNSSLASVK